jgi:hypothetical protein
MPNHHRDESLKFAVSDRFLEPLPDHLLHRAALEGESLEARFCTRGRAWADLKMISWSDGCETSSMRRW